MARAGGVTTDGFGVDKETATHGKRKWLYYTKNGNGSDDKS